MRALLIVGALAALAPAACKPPPTDADLTRKAPRDEPNYASEPLPSPDSEGAMWARSSQAGRIIYGIPGEPALVALECVARDGTSDALQITRLAPADEGAGALLALIGNGAIGRIEVDATEVGSRIVWRGELAAADTRWEPLAGPRRITVTVPGAGIVTLNPSAMPAALLDQCRSNAPVPPAYPR